MLRALHRGIGERRLESHLVPTKAHLIFACEKGSPPKDEIVVASDAIVRRMMVSFTLVSKMEQALCKLEGMRKGERQKLVAFNILAQYRQWWDVRRDGSDAAFDSNYCNDTARCCLIRWVRILRLLKSSHGMYH